MIKTLVSMLQDDTGATSMMRVVTILVVLAVLVPAVWVALKNGQPLQLNSDSLELLGIVLGAKLVQNHQEQTKDPKP